jgi:hypothetical protein
VRSSVGVVFVYDARRRECLQRWRPLHHYGFMRGGDLRFRSTGCLLDSKFVWTEPYARTETCVPPATLVALAPVRPDPRNSVRPRPVTLSDLAVRLPGCAPAPCLPMGQVVTTMIRARGLTAARPVPASGRIQSPVVRTQDSAGRRANVAASQVHVFFLAFPMGHSAMTGTRRLRTTAAMPGSAWALPPALLRFRLTLC